jgi:hypothetical protein
MLPHDRYEAMAVAARLQLELFPNMVAAGEARQQLAGQQQQQQPPLERVSPPHPLSAEAAQDSSCSCAGRLQTPTK